MLKVVGYSFLIVFALMVVGFVFTMMARPFQVVERVTDPDRVLYTYEWFFNKHAAIQGYADQIRTSDAAVEAFKTDHAGNLDTYANSVELARLRAVSQGLRNQEASAVREYNANAQNLTRGVFRDWRLPACLSVVNESGVISEC